MHKDGFTNFCLRGDKYIMEKVRVFSLASDMPTGPPLNLFQILLIISNSMGDVAQDFCFRGDNFITKKVSLAGNTPTGPSLYRISLGQGCVIFSFDGRF